MKSSPLHVSRIVFNKISIEPTISPFGENADSFSFENTDALNYDFEGTNFSVNLDTALAEGQEDNPREYFELLTFGIENKEGKICPYTIDISVGGFFKVSDKFPIEKREDLVAINGASILYGAIREMVSNLSSRLIFGPLTLPTLDFRDYANRSIETESIPKAPELK